MDEIQPAVKTSVLIVSYNCVKALRRCLGALENSMEREAMEILVVDNGSLDESGHLDAEFPEVTFLRLPRNFGLTKARNIGIRTAKGEFLLLLEADTEVLADTVTSLAAHLDDNPAVITVCPLLVDEEGNPVSRTGPLPTHEILYRCWCEGEPWNQPLPGVNIPPPSSLQSSSVELECPDPRALLVRSRFIRGMNYFDERYGQFGSSLELFIQLRRASRKALLLPGVRALSRCGADLWNPADSGTRALLATDYASGALAYTGKHFGWAASMRLRFLMLLRAAMRAMGTLLGMRDAGYHFRLFTLLMKNQKIDGSQQGL